MSKQIYVGGRSHWYDDIPVSTATIAVVCIVVLIAVGIAAFSCSQNGAAEEEAPTVVAEDAEGPDGEQTQEEDPVASPLAELTESSVDAASGTREINLFSALDGASSTLDAAVAAPIEAALAAYAEAGYEAGFVVLDLQTGKGLGYNADEPFFAASTIKAPYVAYVSQELVDRGAARLDDYIEKDIILDGTGIMAEDQNEGYDLATVLTDTIVYSDNTGYGLLREHYDGATWDEWIEGAGYEGESFSGEWYPYYSPRDLAKFWVSIANYLDDGTEGSELVVDLFSSTQNSFLRKALGSEASVLNKAGYEIDTETYDMGALNDAGIVTTPTGSYLIAVMSDADYDDEWLIDNEGLIVGLIDALDAARAAVLAPR